MSMIHETHPRWHFGGCKCQLCHATAQRSFEPLGPDPQETLANAINRLCDVLEQRAEGKSKI